ncbi:LOW QUALITY PROTEIN: NXPE family member 3-like [Synchiropus picturatus]
MAPGWTKATFVKIVAGLLFLTIFFSAILSQYIGFEKVFQKISSTYTSAKRTTAPPYVDPSCKLILPPSDDALGDRRLLDSVAWPHIPPLPVGFSFEKTSSPKASRFSILPAGGGQDRYVGDQLQVTITIRDFLGNPKQFGGDVLVARLHNPSQHAGVGGQITDHLNGSYTATFPLLWDGYAEVEVTFVHPSEAVAVLDRLTREEPDRVSFASLFRSGAVSETTICNYCMRPTKREVCNFTDIHTGQPWFCFKPKKLGCDTRMNHYKNGFHQNLRANEEKLFQNNINMKVVIPPVGNANLTVLPAKNGSSQKRPPPEASGYYYHGDWRSLKGTPVEHFNTSSAIGRCLKGKTIHLFGDSTIRQWFFYLTSAHSGISILHISPLATLLIPSFPGLKEFNLKSNRQTGPFMAMDYQNNILLTFGAHGPPIRFGNINVNNIRYVANELDRIVGGPDMVVVIGIWSHFSSFPVEVYLQRLNSIRRAMERMLRRYPETVIIIRTANLKYLNLQETLVNSDWYSIQRDKVLRAVFKGINVHFVDAWEMTLAHYLPHNLHPQPPIIKNMVDVVLSCICPR